MAARLPQRFLRRNPNPCRIRTNPLWQRNQHPRLQFQRKRRRRNPHHRSAITIASAAVGSQNGAQITKNDANPDTILLLGTINANQPGRTINITGIPVVNNGAIKATGGGAIFQSGISGNLGAGYSATGSGSILSINGNFTIDAGLPISSGALAVLLGNWTNSSSITATNAALNLGGNFRNPGLTFQPRRPQPDQLKSEHHRNHPECDRSHPDLRDPLESRRWKYRRRRHQTLRWLTTLRQRRRHPQRRHPRRNVNLFFSTLSVVGGLTLNSANVSLFSNATFPASLAFVSTQALTGSGLIIFNGNTPTDVSYLPIGQGVTPATLTIGSGAQLITGTESPSSAAASAATTS